MLYVCKCALSLVCVSEYLAQLIMSAKVSKIVSLVSTIFNHWFMEVALANFSMPILGN